VRSLASVALRKAIEDSEYKIHFDYFSLDFNEEYAALYGGYLEQQAEFAGAAMKRIISLYPTTSLNPPSKVVLIGHSMGGLLAKAKMLSGSDVSLVLTLATPHSPVLQLDSATRDFYSLVGSNNTLEGSSNTLVSIGGGLRDLQVRGDLTVAASPWVSLLSSSMSSVWVSTDHLCIVWCKQLVININRALFDMIDPTTKQITEDSSLRQRILEYHFLHRSGGKKFKEEFERHPASLSLDKNGFWADMVKRQLSFSKANTTCDNYLLIKITPEDQRQRFLTVDAFKLDADNWIFGCKQTKVVKNSRICEEAENLSGLSQILPSRGKRKAVTGLDLFKLRESQGFSHVILNTPAKTEDSTLHVDLYGPRDRWVTFSVPKWITFWREYSVIQSTQEAAVFYNLTLHGIEQMWQAYTLTVNPLKCKNKGKPQVGLARFITPWAKDTTQVLLGEPGNSNFTNTLGIKLQTPRPQGSNDTVESPQVHLYLSPTCTYSVTLRASLPQLMGQIARLYSPLLLSCVVVVVILILAHQMRRIEGDNFCQSPQLTLMACVSPVNVVLPSRIAVYVISALSLASYVPKTDLEHLAARGLDFGILPILLFFISISLTLLLIGIITLAVIACGSLAQKAVTRFFTTGVSPGQAVIGELAVSALSKFPPLISTVLISVALASCGSFALCLGCLVYVFQLFSLYQSYLSSLVKRSVGLRPEDDPSLLLALHFQLPLFLLYLSSTLLQLPLGIAYLSLSPGGSLAQDPSLPHSIILSIAMGILWQNEGRPRVSRKYFSILALSLNAAAILVTMFALTSLYRLPVGISCVFILISCHQLLAPGKPQVLQEDVVEGLEQEVTNQEVEDEEESPGNTGAVTEEDNSGNDSE